MFKPTQEQEAIVKAFKTTNMLKINAFAGTGKSSTLQLLANSHPMPSLYIAFNKAIAEEAAEKFPSHVECRTTHSLAFAKFGRPLMHKLSRPRSGGYVNVAGTPSEIAIYYKIKKIVGKNKEEEVSPNVIASIVKDTVRRYEQSSSEDIENSHVAHYMVVDACSERPTVGKRTIVNTVIKYANKLWEDRKNTHSNVLATHDTYLKLYQLSNPVLNYDTIYLDEAQDTGDTVLDIVLKQKHANIVLVGDQFQSIYQFRGAVNAMEKVNCSTMYLTKSFRFGQAVADIANLIIQSDKRVVGFEKIDSMVGVIDYNKPHTRIFRTNAALLQEAICWLMDGKVVSCEVDVNDFKKLIESALELKNSNLKKVKHDIVIPYSTWWEFKQAGKEEPEINRVVKIVESGQGEMFVDYLLKMKRKDDADVIFTTAHKSKGREWGQVYLADDFPMPDENGRLPEAERNLLYVAATRAVDVLLINEAIIKLKEVS